MVSRRTLLLGTTGAAIAVVGTVVGVEAGAFPGQHQDNGAIPDVTTGELVQATFDSAARGTEVGYAISMPQGHRATGLPVVLALHGLHGNHTTGLTLGLPQFQSAAVDSGVPPFAVVTVDAGNGYYHPHHGDDAGAMVLDELLPRLDDAGLDTSRLGFYGWSMGGYGSLRLAAILGSKRVRAIAANSPALWVNPSAASPSGFDDAAEYAHYSVMGHQSDLSGIPVRLEVGDQDPFHDATLAYYAGFAARAATLAVHPGGHHREFWRRMLPGDLQFVGRRLSA